MDTILMVSVVGLSGLTGASVGGLFAALVLAKRSLP